MAADSTLAAGFDWNAFTAGPAFAIIMAGVFVTFCVWITARQLGNAIERAAKALENHNRARAEDLEAVRLKFLQEAEATSRRVIAEVAHRLNTVVAGVDQEIDRLDDNDFKLQRAVNTVAEPIHIAGSELWGGSGGVQGRFDPTVARMAGTETREQAAVADPPPPSQQPMSRQPGIPGAGPPPAQPVGRDDMPLPPSLAAVQQTQQPATHDTQAILHGNFPPEQESYPAPPFNPQDQHEVWKYMIQWLRKSNAVNMPWEPHPHHAGFTIYSTFRVAMIREYGLRMGAQLDEHVQVQFRDVLPGIPAFQNWLGQQQR